MTSVKKRFIAGAVCPRCKATDRIVMYRVDDLDYRECVECGFRDEMRFKAGVREIQTRVNTPAEQVARETQVVRLLDPTADREKRQDGTDED
jgi:uncharacterized metal-binding protein (TIGR02443 family)